MTSNMLSRLLSSESPVTPSVYETMRQFDEASDTDIEERAGMAVDEDNLGRHSFELDADSAHAIENDMGIDHSPKVVNNKNKGKVKPAPIPKWLQSSLSNVEVDEGDDDVPPSLLIETHQAQVPITRASPVARQRDRPQDSPKPIPIDGPSTGATRAKWKATQEQQRLYQDPGVLPTNNNYIRQRNLLIADPKEKALWRWANVENLDIFLTNVYEYYLGNGIWSILLSRVLNLL